MRVSVEDRIDLRGRVLHDVAEDFRLLVRRERHIAVRRTLVVRGDDDVCSLARGELSGDLVDGLDRVAERDALDAIRRNEGGSLFRDRADDGDLEPVDLEDRVRVERVRPIGERDVRGKVWTIGGGRDAAGCIVDALVELVVALRPGVHADRIEHVDCRLVLLDRRLEEARADGVTVGDDKAVLLAEALLRLQHSRGE